ncbi:MAG: DUF2732 family protein [Mixta calida]|uniref:DUF2732 family protein n=1 Tax=Mixta calida TaxID=665913 RepID=UPI0029093D92|nr:DUF2732 family protein [Mixta calida]MDU4942928.1 DUF2732 family protein [Mixta calida]
MRNIENHKYKDDVESMTALLNSARMDERKGRAQVVSERLAEIAEHIHQQGLNGVEAAELIRREAQRYQNESQELH